MALLAVFALLVHLLTPLVDAQTAAAESSHAPEVIRAADWLVKQRLPDWGWGSQAMTPRAILALQVATNCTWCCAGGSVESQMSAKQMELEIVLQLWRHHESPMTPGRLALYSLALNSICHDPRQFHGHDLIGSLMHHEPGMEYEFSMTSLAVCSSGAHVRKRQLRHLLDMAERLSEPQQPSNTSDAFPGDTLSMVLLALNCIVRDHRNRNLDRYIRKPIRALAKTQAADGSFGNLYSTALATQALKAVDNDSSTAAYWNRQAAESFLVSRQGGDGSFGDVFTTTEVILGLSPRGLAMVRDVACNSTAAVAHKPTLPFATGDNNSNNNNNNINNINNVNNNITVAQQEGGDVTVTYTLWVGTNVTEKHSLTITAPRNSTFYYVMQMAGERDPHFVFSATEWPNGHYVHTLAGYKEEPGLYYYWLLYVLPSLPDTAKLPGNQMVSPVGVDGLTIEDGGHYLFWYKKL